MRASRGVSKAGLPSSSFRRPSMAGMRRLLFYLLSPCMMVRTPLQFAQSCCKGKKEW